MSVKTINSPYWEKNMIDLTKILVWTQTNVRVIRISFLTIHPDELKRSLMFNQKFRLINHSLSVTNNFTYLLTHDTNSTDRVASSFVLASRFRHPRRQLFRSQVALTLAWDPIWSPIRALINATRRWELDFKYFKGLRNGSLSDVVRDQRRPSFFARCLVRAARSFPAERADAHSNVWTKYFDRVSRVLDDFRRFWKCLIRLRRARRHRVN